MNKTEEYSFPTSNDVKVNNKTKKNKLDFFEIIGSVVAAVITATIVFLFVFRVFSVEGQSMSPTLENKDLIVVSDIGYKPEVGDVVVLSGAGNYNETIVKRIIAVEGDEVDINFTTGVVTVNGKEETYSDDLTTQQADIAFPIVVPEGTVFVLGDNRDYSIDSRSSRVGCVDERKIVGKVLFKFYPIGDWKVE